MELKALEEDVTEEEIKKAVWGLRVDGAPEPDGFPLFFYQKF